jgi:hypothetical protein
MDSQIWTVISAVAMGLLVPIAGALGVWGTKQVQRWQAKTDLETMRQNAISADQSVEQLYPNAPNEVKASLAAAWTQHLNAVAGITTANTTVQGLHGPISTQTILNESGVQQLPPSHLEGEQYG